MVDDSMQGVTPSNVDNFAAGRWPATTTKEPVDLMTRFEVEAISRREKEKAHMSQICLNIKSLYADEVAAKAGGV